MDISLIQKKKFIEISLNREKIIKIKVKTDTEVNLLKDLFY